MRLLLTRPEPDAARSAVALRARGHAVDTMPLLRVDVVAADFGEGPWGAVLITSANAARSLAAHPRKAELLALPVFAVGRRSADAARAAGFARVTSADADAKALADLVAACVPPGLPILYLAGEDRTADLEAMLAARDLAVRTTVIYRAVMETQLVPQIRAALADGAIDGVLHYSRRSAEAFLAAAEVAGLEVAGLATRHYCLSADVAGVLRAGGVDNIFVAARPDEPALFELLG